MVAFAEYSTCLADFLARDAVRRYSQAVYNKNKEPDRKCIDCVCIGLGEFPSPFDPITNGEECVMASVLTSYSEDDPGDCTENVVLAAGKTRIYPRDVYQWVKAETIRLSNEIAELLEGMGLEVENRVRETISMKERALIVV
jgi:hypothetical protein